MTKPDISAKAWLREARQRANWSRLLLRPVQLPDGTVLFTLKDAAKHVLDLPPTPSSRMAAQRIIDAALHDGDMIATEVAVRVAAMKGKPSKDEPNKLEALYASLTRAPAN
jgi:hypothetical protein